MQVKIDKDPKSRGGDLISISVLSRHLEKTKPIADEFNQRILGLWIDFLRNIEAEAISSNYQGRPMECSFDFPFEDEYNRKHGKLPKEPHKN